MSNVPTTRIIDIRDTTPPVIEQILFAELDQGKSPTVQHAKALFLKKRIYASVPNGATIYTVDSSYAYVDTLVDAQNLIAALNKAIELGWFTK